MTTQPTTNRSGQPSGQDSDVPDSGLARAARGSALNLVGAAFSSLCSFALVAVITHGMDRAHAGVFFSVTSVFLVASAIGQMGTNVGLVYFIARARALGQHSFIAAYLRAAFVPVLAVGIAISLALLLLAPKLGQLTNAEHASLATGYLRTIALFVAPACLATAALAATRGLGTMRPYALVEQIGRQLLQIVLVAVAATLPGSSAITWAWALPYLAAMIAALAWLRWLRRRQRPDANAVAPPVDTAKAFWLYTAPRTIGSIVLLLIQRIDIILVGALASAAQAAVFTAGTRFVVAGQMGGLAVALAVQPALAAALSRRDRRASSRLFQTSAAWLMGVTWPLYLTFCVFGDVLLGVFGSGYDDGATVLIVVTIGMLIGAGCGDVDSVQTMSGRSMLSLMNALLGLAVMLILDFLLIPAHGAIGAAIGWCCAIVAKNFAGLIQAWFTEGLHPFGAAHGLMATLNIACFGALELLIRLLPLPGPMLLALGVGVAGSAYVLGLWLLRRQLQIQEFLTLRRRRKSNPAGVP